MSCVHAQVRALHRCMHPSYPFSSSSVSPPLLVDGRRSFPPNILSMACCTVPQGTTPTPFEVRRATVLLKAAAAGPRGADGVTIRVKPSLAASISRRSRCATCLQWPLQTRADACCRVASAMLNGKVEEGMHAQRPLQPKKWLPQVLFPIRPRYRSEFPLTRRVADGIEHASISPEDQRGSARWWHIAERALQ